LKDLVPEVESEESVERVGDGCRFKQESGDGEDDSEEREFREDGERKGARLGGARRSGEGDVMFEDIA